MLKKLLAFSIIAANQVLAQQALILVSPDDLNPDKVELGKKLFFDTRVSKSGIISCNSCHNLALSGTDNLETSVGHEWEDVGMNSPTVFNSGFQVAQFWNGRAATLEEQAKGPIEAPGEMASNHELTISVLRSIPQYVTEFEQIYDTPDSKSTPEELVNIDNVANAIAEFERSLVTTNSRFDQYAMGNHQALTQEEQDGYQLFTTTGCTACHAGPTFGGTMFMKLGIVGEYDTANPSQGRYDITKDDDDRNVFKVPMLRNIELTYPYFHDGQVKTLEEAVVIMGKIQLGYEFTEEETQKMVAFLKTLSGEIPSVILPKLPPSSKNTPEPEPF